MVLALSQVTAAARPCVHLCVTPTGLTKPADQGCAQALKPPCTARAPPLPPKPPTPHMHSTTDNASPGLHTRGCLATCNASSTPPSFSAFTLSLQSSTSIRNLHTRPSYATCILNLDQPVQPTSQLVQPTKLTGPVLVPVPVTFNPTYLPPFTPPAPTCKPACFLRGEHLQPQPTPPWIAWA